MRPGNMRLGNMRTGNMRTGILRITLVLAVLLAGAPSATHAVQHPAGAGGRASKSVASGQVSVPDDTEMTDPVEDLKRPSPTVIKLGGMVGMTPSTSVIVFQWLNFLVLAGVILYGLAKALPKVFRGRTEKIQRDIVEARVATEEARARLTAVEARLGKLDGDIAALRSDSERAATEDEQRMHVQVEEERQRILQSAEQEIAAASAAAQRTLREYAAGIAVDRAAAQLEITPEDDRILIESFAGRLRSEGSRN